MHCSECNLQFDYFSGESEAYGRFNVPLPSVCPDCRQRRRLTFRNEKKLYYNKSFKSGRKIISLYPETSPFRIIDQDEWWADSFSASEYGMDFDFNKPFFEQYKELQKAVPRWSRIFVNCENSDYTNNCAQVKNSYLTFSSYQSEDLYYCMRVFRSNNCIDCLNVPDSQYCSRCADCKKCYNLHYSLLSENCSDSLGLYDCKGCSDCILCSHLRNKQYMVLNKKYSKEEYLKIKEQFLGKIATDKSFLDEQFKVLLKNAVHKDLNMINTQNSLGNFINDSKNITNGFYIIDSEDCINVYDSSGLKNCYDNAYNEKSELCLEIDTSYELYNSKFCTYTISLKNCAYCDQCAYLENCFGCIGLKREKYMILNKKYSRGEYEKMMGKIAEHMRRTGELGKPFPSTLTPFAYNTTVASDFYPLDKVFAKKLGYMWHEEETEAVYFGKKYEVPLNPAEADESICEKIFSCEETGKNYKIIPQELKFYKTFKLPIPKISQDQRYRRLMGLEPPKKLLDAVCADCGKVTQSVYPAKFGYRVVCEGCYAKAVN